MTPNFAIVRIQNQHSWCPPIPLPLFLLWIPAIVLAPIFVLIVWLVCLGTGLPVWSTIRAFWDVLCGLPGTHVRVCADGNKVTVRIL